MKSKYSKLFLNVKEATVHRRKNSYLQAVQNQTTRKPTNRSQRASSEKVWKATSWRGVRGRSKNCSVKPPRLRVAALMHAKGTIQEKFTNFIFTVALLIAKSVKISCHKKLHTYSTFVLIMSVTVGGD